MKHSRYQTDNTDPSQFAPGQRWISETQAEFGLALIMSTDGTHVTAFFPAVGETLTYAARNAPLRRVAFEAGDTVRNQEGNSFVVSEVKEDDKRLIYVDGEGNELSESSLSDTMNTQRPEQRLLSGVSDDPKLWSLRQSAVRNQHEARARDVRGLIGGRVSLIPHQLYIAEEVANRNAPRVLLADEVGLGKTIEACLILHRLQLSGRAKRILILVPDALVNQWFVELYRRFALSFAIYDEDRAAAIEAGLEEGKNDNPFFDDQMLICATSWLASNPKRAGQAAAAEWDLTIVDEAHHLEWSVESSSPEYDAVEAIAAKSTGLLLLTATPEQLGRAGHFARLRLLDPARFSDLDEFIKESDKYQAISDLADSLNGEAKLTAAQIKQIAKFLGKEAAAKLKEDDVPARRDTCRSELIDLHGTGRVLFRNRRLVLDTFPERNAHLIPLTCEESESFEKKLEWLVTLLKAEPESKILLITHTREMVEKIESELKFVISAQATMFHEGLTLLQRDKNAAWFADEEMGARIMICSEIGSEGRNFQFAHHLVLFDLPSDPGLLEQRIGRLDRIGQTEDIHIHVPFVEGSAEEMLTLWYHNGLGAFENTLHGSSAIHREFRNELEKLTIASAEDRETALPDLLDRTKAYKAKIELELEGGRDHLLEISSFDRDQGEALVSQIEVLDQDTRLEYLMLKLFDHFGVTVEDLATRSYVLLPEHLFSAEAFPGLPEEGMSVTFDRATALAREDITFLTEDHPMVISALESLLSTDHGNAAFFRLEKAGEQLLMVETVSVLECIAPGHLHAERFLPSKPIRRLVDQKGRNRTDDFTTERVRNDGRPGPSSFLREKSKALRATIPGLLELAEKESELRADEIRAEAIERMKEEVGGEVERLIRLKKMGHPVRDAEIEIAQKEQADLEKYLFDTPLRVDSVRLILAMT